MAPDMEGNDASPWGPRAGAPPPFFGKRLQLSDEIVAYIRELIMTGHLRGGQQVNIDALARHLGTSPTPVRDALNVLRGEGFVRSEPRRGFRIAPLSEQDVEDMFLAQGVIAGELAKRATQMATEQLVSEIVRLQDSMGQAHVNSDDEGMEQLNYEFHRVINRAASSPKLTWLLGMVVKSAPRTFYSAIAGWPEASLRDHGAIIESIKVKDPDAARQAMGAHIQHAGELLVDHLKNQGFWSSAPEISFA
jgi:DNA-binding GntR family transcriptional regulator